MSLVGRSVAVNIRDVSFLIAMHTNSVIDMLVCYVLHQLYSVISYLVL